MIFYKKKFTVDVTSTTAFDIISNPNYFNETVALDYRTICSYIDHDELKNNKLFLGDSFSILIKEKSMDIYSKATVTALERPRQIAYTYTIFDAVPSSKFYAAVLSDQSPEEKAEMIANMNRNPTKTVWTVKSKSISISEIICTCHISGEIGFFKKISLWIRGQIELMRGRRYWNSFAAFIEQKAKLSRDIQQ